MASNVYETSRVFFWGSPKKNAKTFHFFFKIENWADRAPAGELKEIRGYLAAPAPYTDRPVIYSCAMAIALQ